MWLGILLSTNDETSKRTNCGLRTIRLFVGYSLTENPESKLIVRLSSDEARNMNHKLVAFLFVLMLAGGCTAIMHLPSSSASPAASDFTPCSSYGTPPAGEEGRPGPWANRLPLTWQLEPGLRVSGETYADPHPHVPLAADVIQLGNGSRFGRYRMFYSVTALGIGSGTSDDGINWTVEPGLRLESQRIEGELHFDVGHPTVVHLADGRWRMYHQTSTGIGTPLRVASAVSSDGLNFTHEEGVRIDIGLDSELSFAGHGRAWRAADGSFWMLLSANTHDDTGPSDIALATSLDGLTWTIVEPHLFVDGHDPTLLVKADGSVTALWMYLDQTFYTSDSVDGLQWSPPVEVLFYDEDGRLLNYSSDTGGDVALLRLDDGSLRLFTNWSDGIRSLIPMDNPPPPLPPRPPQPNLQYPISNLSISSPSTPVTQPPPIAVSRSTTRYIWPNRTTGRTGA